MIYSFVVGDFILSPLERKRMLLKNVHGLMPQHFGEKTYNALICLLLEIPICPKTDAQREELFKTMKIRNA